MKRHYTNVTNQDVSYAELADGSIEFGYVTRAERQTFFKFLLGANIIVPVTDRKWRATCNFSYLTVKNSKRDDQVSTTVTIKRNWEVVNGPNQLILALLTTS
jgi:hypothetical protein